MAGIGNAVIVAWLVIDSCMVRQVASDKKQCDNAQSDNEQLKMSKSKHGTLFPLKLRCHWADQGQEQE